MLPEGAVFDARLYIELCEAVCRVPYDAMLLGLCRVSVLVMCWTDVPPSVYVCIAFPVLVC